MAATAASAASATARLRGTAVSKRRVSRSFGGLPTLETCPSQPCAIAAERRCFWRPMLQIQLTSATREEVLSGMYVPRLAPSIHPSIHTRQIAGSVHGPWAAGTAKRPWRAWVPVPGIEYIVVGAIGCGSPVMLRPKRTSTIRIGIQTNPRRPVAHLPGNWELRRTQGEGDEWVWGNSCIRNRWVSSCHKPLPCSRPSSLPQARPAPISRRSPQQFSCGGRRQRPWRASLRDRAHSGVFASSGKCSFPLSSS